MNTSTSTAPLTTQALRDLYARYVMPTYAQTISIVRGEGVRVWDAEGKEYLDFSAGIAVNALGHAHPEVTAAIAAQSARLTHASNLYFTENAPRLARRLSELSLGGKVFFCNSGAEANEALIKLARLHGSASGRYEIITMRNSFHGRTLATMTATGQTKYQHGFEPLVPGFVYADFNDLDSVRAAITPRTAAVLLEAVQGEGGILPADPAFLAGLRDLCTREGVLLFFDEVQAGIGRTGKWFAYQHYGIEPDGISIAKALANGLPIGAAVASPALSDTFSPGKHASTFGGNPVSCAAALATLEVIERDHLVGHAAEAGRQLMASIDALRPRHPCIQTVRGLGFMIGIVLDRPCRPVADALRDAGLLVIPTGERVLRLVPPLITGDDDIARALDILDGVLPT